MWPFFTDYINNGSKSNVLSNKKLESSAAKSIDFGFRFIIFKIFESH